MKKTNPKLLSRCTSVKGKDLGGFRRCSRQFRKASSSQLHSPPCTAPTTLPVAKLALLFASVPQSSGCASTCFNLLRR